MWRKPKPPEPEYVTKVRKRVERLSVVELLDWCDQAGSGVARALLDYRRGGARDSLLEAKMGLDALQAVVDDLLARDVR